MTDEEEILTDIKRHSTLHIIDQCCGSALTAIIPAIKAAGEHGLLDELDAVRDALSSLHAKAKAKWMALS